jgi:hypothetical protein
MWRRAQAIGDRDVARQMRKVFGQFPATARDDPDAAALAYGKLMFTPTPVADSEPHFTIRGEKKFLGKSFTVGLRAETREFEQLTKRVALVSDCLLLSHGPDARYCHLGEDRDYSAFTLGDDAPRHVRRKTRIIYYGMHCSDPTALGAWLLQAELLLKAGLAWYLPSYSTRTEYESYHAGTTDETIGAPVSQVTAVDYIIKGGRIVDSSESNPVKDRLIRHFANHRTHAAGARCSRRRPRTP